MDLRFNIKGIDQVEALKEYCARRFEHLSTFNNQILSAYIDFHHSTHHRKGAIFHVDVCLEIPKRKLYAKKDANSFNEATDQVVEALRKQLVRYAKREQRLRKFSWRIFRK